MHNRRQDRGSQDAYFPHEQEVSQFKEEPRMLTLVDSGCQKHELLQFNLQGLTTLVIMGVLSNLPQDGNYHTYTCEHGKTHRLSFQVHRATRCLMSRGLEV
jgi:hypothetical protein